MARRLVKNKTNLKRIPNVPTNEVFVFFVCLKCSYYNTINVGNKLISPSEAYENAVWRCKNCDFIHSKTSLLPIKDDYGKKLPFSDWDKEFIMPKSLHVQRFWKAFFTSATESKEVYWKQCNTCGKVLPEKSFSRHKGWGPLEKQLECRSCKAVINTDQNPKRTKEQLHESSSRRRVAELLLKGENERIDSKELFKRFNSRCFKMGTTLNIKNRKSWAIDHTLPSRWLYPLSIANATLLSKEANDNKSDKWPSEFYSNEELKKLAILTGANLELIARKKPLVNKNIDVNACVERMLTVRRLTDMSKRIKELKKMLEDYNLVKKLSKKNKGLLGYKD